MKFNSLGKRIAENYRILALIVLNSIIVLLVVNLLASGIIDFRDYYRKKAESGEGRYGFKNYEDSTKKLFPDLERDEIEQFLTDTRHLSQCFDTYTQFKERPFVGKSVNVDAKGFRPIKNQGPWPPAPEHINIFVFGGSTTFGYGVPDVETIPSYLQEILNCEHNGRVRVYNFGRGGYISIQERVLLEKLILEGMVPQVAIFIDGLNDLGYCQEEPNFTNELTKYMDEGDSPPFIKNVMQMPIFKLIFDYPREKAKVQTSLSKEKITNTIRRYEVNKEIIESFCSHFNIEPLFVWQPVPVYKCDQDYNFFATFNYDRYMSYLRVGYQEMANIFANRKFGENFLWLTDMQEGLREPLYADAIHYSPYLCKLIAQKIADKLEEQKMIKDVSVNR